MMADTSLDAWKTIKETLSTRQLAVYHTIRKYPEHTSAEIACIMRCHTNSSAPRITELRKLNKVVRVLRRECAVTHGIAWTWSIVE